jgi:putative transposase
LHAFCDGDGKPLILLPTEGQVSGYRGAATVLPVLPPDATAMIADRGYDSDWLREALSDLDITPCIPGRKKRKVPVEYDTKPYRQHNLVERMFGRLKDWRRVATRYYRCAHTFISAICIAATVIF